MLLGAFLAFVIELFNNAVGSGSEWERYAPLAYAIFGALIGLCVDLYTRTKDERARREVLLAAFMLVSLAIIWAGLIR